MNAFLENSIWNKDGVKARFLSVCLEVVPIVVTKVMRRTTLVEQDQLMFILYSKIGGKSMFLGE